MDSILNEFGLFQGIRPATVLGGMRKFEKKIKPRRK